MASDKHSPLLLKLKALLDGEIVISVQEISKEGVAEKVDNIFKLVMTRRKTDDTSKKDKGVLVSGNDVSSRSHLLVGLKVMGVNGEVITTFKLLDMAGSERFTQGKNAEQTQVWSGHLSLGRPQCCRVPFGC